MNPNEKDLYQKRGPRNEFNLAGQKFGFLTPLFIDGHNSNGDALWRCKCDCGKIRHTTSKRLRDGRVKSCGCMKEFKDRKLGDLWNRTFGGNNGKTK